MPRFRPAVNPAQGVDVNAFVERQRRLEATWETAVKSARLTEATQAQVARLSDPSFAVRQAAVEALRAPGVEDAELWATLDRVKLDDEAHDRLLQLAVRRVLEKPRGALGVRMGPAPLPRVGVLVQSTLPGLPAEQVLKSGDVIEKVDGVPVRESNDLAECLQSKPPGAEVTLLVLRAERDGKGRPLAGADGKPVERRMEFRLPLGNANDLDRFDPAGARLPAGIGNINTPLEQRREQAAWLQRRFVRPLPGAIPVPPEPEPSN